MTATDSAPVSRAAEAAPAGAVAWGNSGPLALAAFAITTFLLSLINLGAVSAGTIGVVVATALTFGGLTQLIAGIIQFRTGNTFGGVLFSTFGAFWLSFFAYVHFFAAGTPKADEGHAVGIWLIGFGIFTVWIWLASFRSNAVVVLALADLALTFFVLGFGNYSGSSGMVKFGGVLGLVVAFLAAYLSFAELCEATYKRSVVPLWPLAK